MTNEHLEAVGGGKLKSSFTCPGLTVNSATEINPPPILNKRIPGETGIWVLVLGDALVFSLLFITFLAYRSQEITLYQTSQAQLNAHFGAINTLLLLASSWCVVTALQAVRQLQDELAIRLFKSAWLCGLAFAVVKVIEYSGKFSQGITPLTNEFFMFYFVLTGLHFVHLLVGLGVLSFMLRMVKKSSPAKQRLNALECGATFWHLVDLLWIVLFPLLYLIS